MKIGFIGCVDSSLRFLDTLLLLKPEGIEVVAVVTKEVSSINSDHADLAPLCRKNDIPFHYEENRAQEKSVEFLSAYKPDVVYCFGWSHLLGKETLNIAPLGVIGFHPSPLPIGRGRHPIIWALVLGLTETASTFFHMDEGADSGAIISQKSIGITLKDDASTLYEKILTFGSKQIVDFSRELAAGANKAVPQNHAAATYWRKRVRTDGVVDWRMTAEDIYNLVRALKHPYPGAEVCYKEQKVKVWSVTISEHQFPRCIEPGKILKVEDQRVLVKCGKESGLWLNDSIIDSAEVGDYL
jgi:methionyl-tRNA formyltransferase